MPASEPALMARLECHVKKKKSKGQKNDDLAQSFRSNDKVICYCKQSVLCVRKLLEKAISTAMLSLSELGNLQRKPPRS